MPRTPQQIRRKLLNALDMNALHRLSDRLHPERCDKATLIAEITEQWPAMPVWAEFDDLLTRAKRETE